MADVEGCTVIVNVLAPGQYQATLHLASEGEQQDASPQPIAGGRVIPLTTSCISPGYSVPVAI